MMKRRAGLHLLAGLAAGGFAHVYAQTKKSPQPLRVAAASDLKFALTELCRAFERTTGSPVELQFGSSGNLARQIQQGLPLDLFMSADENLVFGLTDAGLTQDRGHIYGTGRIVLFVPKGSALVLPAQSATTAPGQALRQQQIKQLTEQLSAQLKGVRKFAIANPEHAPYGRAAKEALQNLGLWEQLVPKLVLGDNISQATQFVTSGAAQAGITALSLALAPAVAALGRHWLLPASLHAPLRQRMVLLKTAQPGARALLDYLQTPAARELLEKYGFTA